VAFWPSITFEPEMLDSQIKETFKKDSYHSLVFNKNLSQKISICTQGW